jgi:hypothetical protein
MKKLTLLVSEVSIRDIDKTTFGVFDAFAIKDKLKSAGGRWNPNMKAWVFKIADKDKISKKIGVTTNIAKPSPTPDAELVPLFLPMFTSEKLAKILEDKGCKQKFNGDWYGPPQLKEYLKKYVQDFLHPPRQVVIPTPVTKPSYTPPKGAKYITNKANPSALKYNVGDVIRFPKIPGGGGDGFYWTVIKSSRIKEFDHDDDVIWNEVTYIFPSTDAECMQLMAAHMTASETKSFITDLVKDLMASPKVNNRPMPSGVKFPIPDKTILGWNSLTLVRHSDSDLYLYHGGHYDDYQTTLWHTKDQDLIAKFDALK